MDRWDWQAIRAYAPSVALTVAGALAGLVEISLSTSPIFSSVTQMLGWVPDVLFAAALAHVAWVSWRLWRSQHGEGLLCSCGGLLGGQIDGRWGPYRKCLACNKNVSTKHDD